MARRPKKRATTLTRKQLSKVERERRQERMLILGMAVVFALIIGVLGFGFYREYIAKAAAPVAVVNGVPIRTDAYQKMVRYRRYGLNVYISNLRAQQQRIDPTDESQQLLLQYIGQEIERAKSQMDNLPVQTLDDMIEDELIRQGAAENGISVSTEEIDRRIEELFGYQQEVSTARPTVVTPTTPGTVTPEATTITTTPTPSVAVITRAEFEEQYERYLTQLGSETHMSEADYRRLVETELLRERMQDFLAEQVPTKAEQVHARHILVETKEEAQAALERLEKGEDFAALARELSTDEASKEKGGDLGWFPRRLMVPEFEAVAFTLEPGEVSQVVQSTFGYHVIEVLEREEERELEPQALQRLRNKAFFDWLEEQREAAVIEKF